MAEPTTPKPRLDRQPLWRHMLGAHLRTLRHGRDETLTETARRAGVSTQYLSEIERGTKEPSSEVIAAVAEALDVTLLDLTVAVAEGLRETQRATTAPVQAPRGPALFALAA
jgi:transcriptional regulator with XRE-family HTH domain